MGTSVDARMCAEGVGERDVGNEWGEGPVGMSERGCGEMCGQFVQGKRGNGRGEGPVGMSRRGCADVYGRLGARERLEKGREKDRWA